jgi:hypothetical protein
VVRDGLLRLKFDPVRHPVPQRQEHLQGECCLDHQPMCDRCQKCLVHRLLHTCLLFCNNIASMSCIAVSTRPSAHPEPGNRFSAVPCILVLQHMFHQANMGTAGGTNKSLLQRWVHL